MRDDTSPMRPLTPDFASYAVGDLPMLSIDRSFVLATWPDGLSHRFHALFLRENEVTSGIVEGVTRERTIEIDQFPAETRATDVRLTDGPAVRITWAPDGVTSLFDPGWLRAMAEGAWHPDYDIPGQQPWDTAAMPEPPTFDGPSALEDDETLDAWLRAAWTYGFARLRGLPVDSGTVQRVGERIGTVRSSNFGFLFSVETKPDPDSTAYTAAGLDGHTDLATRETQPGLQMLHCQENSATGGASTMADGFAVAEAIRTEDPDAFDALTTLNWVFTNRHTDTDYRFSGPIVELNRDGQVVEIRNTGFLRFFPDMSAEDTPRAYRAVQLFNTHCRSDRFLCRTPLRAGDLILFDNRRMLHGRDSFDPQSGTRRLQGCYLDRDEILSRLRILARNRRAKVLSS
ncbi:MAG: TauD/TfdA family dioxygenase [Pseudomonadota bacterium]